MSTGQVEPTQIPDFYKRTNVDESTGATHTLYGKLDGKGNIDRANHVHYHKDGCTVTKGGNKYPLGGSYRGSK